MAEWRFSRGWTAAELAPRIAAAASLSPSAPEGPLTRAAGWNQVLSRAVIAVAPPGPPRNEGAFEHARLLVCRLGFSDPRIVVGHWRPNAKLRGRAVLLELKSAGLHFLCPVRIGAVLDEQDERATSFGFRFDTLEGHVESGREWFVLTQHHDTGEVTFQIEASWRGGEFPNWWSKIGFHLLGRRYQRAWHRLAHQHLREALLKWNRGEKRARGHAARHPALSAPVQFFAQRALKVVEVDEEAEHMHQDKGWLAAAGFGALSGGRSMMGPALLLRQKQRHPGSFSPRKLGMFSRLLQAAAAAELIADKLPFAPSRTQAISLVGRAASGGIVGASVSPRSRAAGFALGAAGAIAASYVLRALRGLLTERLRVPNVVAGLLEDGVVIGLGSKLSAR